MTQYGRTSGTWKKRIWVFWNIQWKNNCRKTPLIQETVPGILQCSLFTKKTSNWRLLRDLRRINEVIEEIGPLQLGHPSLPMIPREWPFLIIDVKDCFFNTPPHPEDAPQLPFSVASINSQEPLQRYNWVVLPKGLENVPTLWTERSDSIFSLFSPLWMEVAASLLCPFSYCPCWLVPVCAAASASLRHQLIMFSSAGCATHHLSYPRF